MLQPLPKLVQRYFERGYNLFDRLCRTAHAEVLPESDCVIAPRERIVAERSVARQPARGGAAPDYVCEARSPTVQRAGRTS